MTCYADIETVSTGINEGRYPAVKAFGRNILWTVHGIYLMAL